MYRRALLEACEAAGEPVPTVSVIRMDVPGMTAGYSDGAPMVAVDPEGVRALFAHELDHSGTDIWTDAVREFRLLFLVPFSLSGSRMV